MTDLKTHVKKLIEKAAEESAIPDAALKYSQAALNAANAIAVLKNES